MSSSEATTLSKEVHDELITEAGINEDKAKELAEKVRLNETVHKNPHKENARSLLTKKLTKIYNKITQQKTKYVTITNITLTDRNKVALKFKHPQLKRNRGSTVEPDNQKLSNLMEYHNVNNPNNLTGKKVLVTNVNNNDPTRIKIPHNVSTLGKYKYNLSTSLRNISKKIPINPQTTIIPELSVVTLVLGIIWGVFLSNSLGPTLTTPQQILVSAPSLIPIISLLFIVIAFFIDQILKHIESNYDTLHLH